MNRRNKVIIVAKSLIVLLLGVVGFMVMTVSAFCLVIFQKEAADPIPYFNEFDHPDEVSEMVWSIINSNNSTRCHDSFRMNKALFLKLCDLLRLYSN